MRTVLLGIVSALSMLGASPTREMLTQAIAAGSLRAPEFRHGYEVMFQPDGPAYGFTAYAPDGSPALTTTIDVPGGTHAEVADVDFDSDGNAAVSAVALGNSGYLQGILLLDRTGRLTRFIDTGRFLPGHVTIAPDHSIWALGWQRDADNPTVKDRQDYTIVRQYSADGKEMKAVLPRSSFPNGLEPGSPGAGPQIAVTADRVGVLVYSGHTSDNREWVELDLNGTLLYRSRIDNIVRAPTQAVFSADDHVYLQGEGKGELYTLNGASHTWKPIQNQGEMLMGSDGNSLVYRKGCCGPVQLQWFDQP
jgi:hypothetical protein